ncbi:MAG TPA: ABC transporter permease [Pirellulales bacterium]
MSFFTWRTWQLGITNLLLHPMRSALTVLGIFIGTASVIWLLAIGEGISRKAQEQIAGLGADNVIVRTVKPADGGATGSASSMFTEYGLKRDDYKRIMGTVPSIDRALRIRELRQTFRHFLFQLDGRLVGCEPAYADVNMLRIDYGRFLSQRDLDEADNVCVLAGQTAARLFPAQDPIGQAVQVENDRYTVIGVLRDRNATAAVGGSLAAQEFDKDIYVPITTLWKRIGDRVMTVRGSSREGEIVELSQMTLHVRNMDEVMETAKIVEGTLAQFHRRQDYAVVVPMELLEQARTTQMMFMLFMGLIAAISLVVGGIGIMNIMLATVTERTREIGIRRALGARRSDITRQFLSETAVLSVVGGLTGVIGGIMCGIVTETVRDLIFAAFPKVRDDLPELMRQISPILVPWSIPLAFGISVAVGIAFGIYPAIRAAKMDPIDALRHE